MIDWQAAERLARPGPNRRAAPTRPGHVPGEAGIWVLVGGDLLVFSLFFAVLMHGRGQDVAGFERARHSLNLIVGTASTLSLLAGSVLVVLGVQAVREGRAQDAARRFSLTLLCGAAFVAGKILEYAHQLSVGHSPHAHDFFMYYFVLTGVHLVHTLLAMVLVALMRRTARTRAVDAHALRTVEAFGVFWHLIDLLWLILFALFYLVR